MTYFKEVKNANDLKTLFRNLCNTLHPDKGGKANEFIKMMDEYNSLKDSFNKDGDNENLSSDKFYNLLQTLNNLEGVEIQFIGSFIWLFDIELGSLYKQKDLIKSFSLDGYNTARWANAKKSWFFSPLEYSRKGGKTYDIGEIRNKYGVNAFKSKGGYKIG